MTNLDRALLVAERAHSNQSYDIYPYIYHVKEVVELADKYGFDESIKIACALHDTLEDDQLSYNDICKAFGIEVADIVYAVTDELGKSRADKKRKTYPKIRANWKAVAVKLCDRLANMKHAKSYNSTKFKNYVKEWVDFKVEIYNPHHPSDLSALWVALDRMVEYA